MLADARLSGIQIRKGCFLPGQAKAKACLQMPVPGYPEILVRLRELHEHRHEPIPGEDQHAVLIQAGGDLHRLEAEGHAILRPFGPNARGGPPHT